MANDSIKDTEQDFFKLPLKTHIVGAFGDTGGAKTMYSHTMAEALSKAQKGDLIISYGAIVNYTPKENVKVIFARTCTNYRLISGVINQTEDNIPTISYFAQESLGTLTATYIGVGMYGITSNNVNEFPASKTQILPITNDSPLENQLFASWAAGSGGFILFQGKDSGSNYTDGLYNGNYFEIKIYP